MITEKVIKEIYRKFNKPPHSREDLHLEMYLDKVNQNHRVCQQGEEIIINDLDEFNPFRRFLIRSLNTIIEFDRLIAFVFNNHILFFAKENNGLRIHFKPEELPKRKNFFGRIFSR